MQDLGTLFITGISGLTLTEDEKQFIQENKIGGVILFKHNYESPAQLAELVNSVQALRDEHPMFVSVDQEGGRVWRFKDGFTVFPAMHKVASLSSPKLFFEVYQIMANELKLCGINLNFAPVCDILRQNTTNAIGDRAYGEDSEEVSKYVTAAVRGLQTNGVLACAKHFPGHGGTSKDSHLDLPVVKTSMQELEKIDFVPFLKAVKARVAFLMTSHLVVDALDSENPSTLSQKAYDYIRQTFRYKGVIVSDDMSMGALTKNFPIGESAVSAIKSGCDVLVYREFEHMVTGFEALKEAYRTKEIKANDLKDKVDRVVQLRKDSFPDYKPIYIPEILNQLNTAESQKFLDGLLERIG